MTRAWPKADTRGLARFVNVDATRWLRIDPNRTDTALLEPDGRRRIAQAIYEELLTKGIRYSTEKYPSMGVSQEVRTTGEILDSPNEGTCLDLAVLFAGLALGNGLLPVVIVTERHALTAISLTHGPGQWDAYDRPDRELFAEEPLTDPAPLIELVRGGSFLAVECTGFSQSAALAEAVPEGRGRVDGLMPFARAIVAGAEQLERTESPFRFALDVVTAQQGWDMMPESLPSNMRLEVERVVVDLTHGAPGFGVERLKSPASVRRLPRPHRTGRPVSGFVDRKEQSQSITAAFAAGTAVSVMGRDGIGRSALAKHVANDPATGLDQRPDGIVYLDATDRGRDDIVQQIWESFYEAEPPIRVGRARAQRELGDIDATVILDEPDLEAADLDAVRDTAPNIRFVVTTNESGPRHDAERLTLQGLDAADGVDLFASEVDRALGIEDQQAVAEIVAALDGHPGRIIEAARLIADTGIAVDAALTDLRAQLADETRPVAGRVIGLDPTETKVIAALAAFEGKSVGTAHIEAIVGEPDTAAALARLEDRSLVASHSPRYSVSPTVAADIARIWDLDPWRSKAIDHFVHGTDRMTPEQIVAERPALLSTLQWADHRRDWASVIKLGQGIETPLVLGRHWDAWALVTDTTKRAAIETGNKRLVGRAMHQDGTHALSIGDEAGARTLLREALEYRESIGDEVGARLTRRNLDLIEPLAPTDPGPEDGPEPPDQPPPEPPTPPRPPRRWLKWLLGGTGAVAAVVVGAGVYCGVTDCGSTTTETTTITQAPTTVAPTTVAPTTVTVPPVGRLEVRPSAVTFPDGLIGAALIESIEIANVGDGTMTIDTVGLATGDEFSVVGDGCTGAELGAGESCEVAVEFVGARAGPASDALIIAGTEGPLGEVPLVATASGSPELVAEPSTVEFGEVAPGEVASSGTAIINQGNAPIDIAGFQFVGDGDFAVIDHSCQRIAEDQACEVALSFTAPPIAASSEVRRGVLQLISTDGVALEVPLVGTVIAPLADLQVSLLSTQQVEIGVTFAIEAQILVENAANGNAGGFAITALRDSEGGNPIGALPIGTSLRALGDSIQLDGLGAGDAMELTVYLGIPQEVDPAGPLLVFVAVDSCSAAPCDVAETNESNNGSNAINANPIVARSAVTLDARAIERFNAGTNFMELIADALVWQSEFTQYPTNLALVHAGAMAVDTSIPPGAIYELQVRRWFVDPSTPISVVGVTPEDIKAFLEHGVSAFENWDGTDAWREPADGRFAHISGMRLQWWPQSNVGSRASNVELEDGTTIVAGWEVDEYAGFFDLLLPQSLVFGEFGYSTEGLSGTRLNGTRLDEATLFYLREGLGGVIGEQYDEDAERRITTAFLI